MHPSLVIPSFGVPGDGRLLGRSVLCAFACRYGSETTGVSLELFFYRDVQCLLIAIMT